MPRDSISTNTSLNNLKKNNRFTSLATIETTITLMPDNIDRSTPEHMPQLPSHPSQYPNDTPKTTQHLIPNPVRGSHDLNDMIRNITLKRTQKEQMVMRLKTSHT